MWFQMQSERKKRRWERRGLRVGVTESHPRAPPSIRTCKARTFNTSSYHGCTCAYTFVNVAHTLYVREPSIWFPMRLWIRIAYSYYRPHSVLHFVFRLRWWWRTGVHKFRVSWTTLFYFSPLISSNSTEKSINNS